MNMWAKAAYGRATWAQEWGKKHGNNGVNQAGLEVEKLLDASIETSEIIRSAAYAVCLKAYHKEVLNN